MRLFLSLLATLPGLFGGAILGYTIYVPAYFILMQVKPLDEAGECVRGNALAYLSIILGAFFGIIVAPLIVWKTYKKNTSIQAASI
jgi:hypothetical protein